MNALRELRVAFWLVALGAVILYLFFVMLDAFDPADAWIATVGAAILAVLLVIHFVRVRRALRRGGDNEARQELNKMRERRGF